jgi:hypothetical protein
MGEGPLQSRWALAIKVSDATDNTTSFDSNGVPCRTRWATATKKPRLYNAWGEARNLPGPIHVEWGNSVNNGTGDGLNAGWTMPRVAGRTRKPPLHS